MRLLCRLALIPLAVLLIMVGVVQFTASRAARARPQLDLDMMITMPSEGPYRSVRCSPRSSDGRSGRRPRPSSRGTPSPGWGA